MRHPLLLLLLFVTGSPCWARPEAQALAGRIDHHLRQSWQANKITPAGLASEATFIRRVYLDLVGRIPTVTETRTFLNEKNADKRHQLVQRLLKSPGHANHWATFWRREWIPQTNQPGSPLVDEIESWLKQRLRDNVAYDRMAYELLTAPPSRGTEEETPATFLTASEFKPENLAANTTRAFLGINLDCAQCHDHPFARWTREQFWQTAAFFIRVSNEDWKRSQFVLEIPNTQRMVKPRLLDGQQPTWPSNLKANTGRILLTRWVTARDNPYFARNAVNRVWANLFGIGLVEPLDDLSRDNAASHPELLDELARGFIESGFDLRLLVSAMVSSQAYQLSAEFKQGTDVDPQMFSRAAVRGLTGEQLYDSLRLAAGLALEREDLDPLHAHQERKQFAEKFRLERPGTAQRSILQSLALMNGKLTHSLTQGKSTPLLRSLSEAPFLSTEDRIEGLYLAALSRKPNQQELAGLVRHVNKGDASGHPGDALADIFWALLNSSEFNTNH